MKSRKKSNSKSRVQKAAAQDPKDRSLQDCFLKKQKLDDENKTEPKNTASPIMQDTDVKAKPLSTP